MSRAPKLVVPPRDYSQDWMEQLTNQLRLYFAQIDNEGSNVRAVIAMANTNQTLSNVNSTAQIVELTGALTATRDLVVPLTPRQWTVFANTTGAHGVRIIGASGTGITIADTKRAIVYADGTNVVRATPDT